MKKHVKFNLLSLFVVALMFSSVVYGQKKVYIHSHNNYQQPIPFYHAYVQQVESMEADIHATDKDGELLVGHDPKDLPTAPTLDEAYIRPLVNVFKVNSGRAWPNSDKTLILLIDQKTSQEKTFYRLISKLEKYPEVFDPTVNPYAVRVVITGNGPHPDDYGKCPSFITFDGSKLDYTTKQLEKITMISLPFFQYSKWKGDVEIPKEDCLKIEELIDKVHSLGKPIRFWGAPDNPNAWKILREMGVDYVNTDKPEECVEYFRNLK